MSIQPSSGIRLPALLAGLCLCGVIAVGLPYGEFVVQGTRLGLSSSTPAAFFLLFGLLVLIQPCLGLLNKRWRFNRAELLLITVGMMLATAIPSRGFTGVALAIMSSVSYYSTLENNWAEELIPYIPSWIMPHDQAAIKLFYEGLPQGESLPWMAWIESVGWWVLFMGAFYVVLLCGMVLLRRQWMEHERLLYPLMQVPLGMIGEEEQSSRLPVFLKNPVMWYGFAVPFIFNSINALSRYYESIGQFDLNLAFQVARNTVTINIRLNYLMMGLAYLINTGISFSLWFFYLLAKGQEAICSILGIYSAESLGRFGHTGATTGMLSHQGMGAMIVLVLLGLWSARSHLRQVWQQAWGHRERSDDGELISYRGALLGLLGGLVVMALWLWRSGMPPWAVALFLFGQFVIFLALTRVIVEAGLSSAVEGLTGAGFVVSGVGSTALGPAGMLGMGYTMAWAGDLLVFMMAPCANGLRLLHGQVRNRRRSLVFLGLALAIGLLGSIIMTLKLGYKYGGLNLHQQYFSWFAQEPFKFASRFIENPVGPHWPGWGWTGLGAAMMGGLMLARHFWLWWPLHPIGFVVGGTWILNSVWFSIFLAWLVKIAVIKYTGPTGYRVTRWFFLGMIMGQFVVGGIWLIIDSFTGMTGNRIRMY
ncbi:MAG: hypothetical protein GKR89_18830 [Candidatus Latescibacteria bacterium]|nr:hypothetical protein [Candidatus Latescibacterota bacterium]